MHEVDENGKRKNKPGNRPRGPGGEELNPHLYPGQQVVMPAPESDSTGDGTNHSFRIPTGLLLDLSIGADGVRIGFATEPWRYYAAAAIVAVVVVVIAFPAAAPVVAIAVMAV